MKKNLLCFLLLSCIFTNAQDVLSIPNDEQNLLTSLKTEYDFTKGNFIVDGNISITSSRDRTINKKNASYYFSPQLGYFFTNKFAVGVMFNVLTSKYNDSMTEVMTKETTIGGGVFSRYYFLDLSRRIKIYGQLNAAFYSLKRDYTSNQIYTTNKESGFNTGLDLGINYFVSPKLAVNFALADIINYRNQKIKEGDTTTDFNIKLNRFSNLLNTPVFGLTFIF